MLAYIVLCLYLYFSVREFPFVIQSFVVTRHSVSARSSYNTHTHTHTHTLLLLYSHLSSRVIQLVLVHPSTMFYLSVYFILSM